MEHAGIAAYASPQPGPDDPSFFFLRGREAVLAFVRALRAVTAMSSIQAVLGPIFSLGRRERRASGGVAVRGNRHH
jgi:hypothetical protein